jgi:anti-sigma regulatory factor (Ser/Thr protein kinase)
MTSVPPLARAADNDTSWSWLALAAEMAGYTCSAMPPGSSCFPRVATRSPGRDPASVRPAREFARSTLWRWGIAERCDDITTVISELVTNALRYGRPASGGWPVRLGLLQERPGSGVLCAVADSSPAPPVPKPPGGRTEYGRGLHVVAGLSDRWGCTTAGERGKVVWATFATARHAALPRDLR